MQVGLAVAKGRINASPIVPFIPVACESMGLFVLPCTFFSHRGNFGFARAHSFFVCHCQLDPHWTLDQIRESGHQGMQ